MHVKKSLPLLVDFPGETERQRVISGRKFATANPSCDGLMCAAPLALITHFFDPAFRRQ